jgi:hypothetical protein
MERFLPRNQSRAGLNFYLSLPGLTRQSSKPGHQRKIQVAGYWSPAYAGMTDPTAAACLNNRPAP